MNTIKNTNNIDKIEDSCEKFFNVEGMSCAACSAAVERVTKKLPGVVESDVNLTTKTMRIRFNKNITTDEDIIQSVGKAGFLCAQKNEGEQKSSIQKKENTASGKIKAENKALFSLLSAWFFAIVLMYIAMGHMIHLPLPSLIAPKYYPTNFALAQLLCTLGIIFIGRDFYIRGYRALFFKNPNMDSLVALGSSAALIYSLVLTFLIPQNPALAHALFYEAAGIVLVFVKTGKYLEEKSTKKTQEAITQLTALMPEDAWFVHHFNTNNESVEKKLRNSVHVGDIVLVKTGEYIPLDGVVLKGYSSVDESMLTGESIPVEKTPDSLVIGGSLNYNGMLYIKITKIGTDTQLAKIIKLIEEAQGKKAPISKIADKVSGIFVPIVILIAIITAIIWLFLGKDISFILTVSTAVLVIACPCALGLATPAAIMTGTGLGAKNGILIRSGEVLEKAKYIDTVVFDKTGTITKGEPEIKGVFFANNKDELSENQLLGLVKAIETASAHPLARAFEQKENEFLNNAYFKVLSFENVSGKGVRATIQATNMKEKNILKKDSTVLLGNKNFLTEENIEDTCLDTIAATEAKKGYSLIFVSIEHKLRALISIGDTIINTATEAILQLQKQGIKSVLLTGDNKLAAQYTADIVGIDTVYAQVLPAEKASVIESLQKQGKKVLMVGDGINDAPALSQADVGIALGTGSDIALNSGDMVIVKQDLRAIPKAIKLSRLTIRTIKQNLFWAFCYNVICIPIAAGILYPQTGILLSPMFASLAMSFSSIFVVGNALLLRSKKL